MKRVLMLAIVGALGCDGLAPKPNWQRMIHQRHALAYSASPEFGDGRTMRPPPLGTVPRERRLESEPPPPPLTAAVLRTGRKRFETYCAACHGVDGSGESDVARKMELKKPPSLLTELVRSYSDLKIFRVITAGWGLMPAYGGELSTDDAWATVNYVRALEFRQNVRLRDLSAEERRAAEGALQ